MSQRELDWKQLFEKKGWMVNDEIVAPHDKELWISIGNENWEFCVPEQGVVLKSEGAILIVSREESKIDQFYLWEDVQCVRFTVRRTEM